MKRPASIVFLFAAAATLLLSVSSVSASHQQDILGDSTVASRVNFPPVTAGPGYILPDNPLYFLDKLVQQVRVATAVTPEQRALVRLRIEGERFAELRIMMERNNKDGIASTLHDMAREAELASRELNDAAARGKNVSVLAKEVSDTLSVHRETLAAVIPQTDGALALQLTALRDELLVSKLQAADNMSEEDFLFAFDTDLEAELDSQVLGVETTVNKLDKRINQFEKNAELKEKLEASREAMRLKKEDLKQQLKDNKQQLKNKQQKLKEELKKKHEQARERRKKRLEEAREAARKAREAAKRFKEAREAQKRSNVENGEENSLTPTIKPEIEREDEAESSNRGSGSSNSGSGSSNSGSGSSKSSGDSK